MDYQWEEPPPPARSGWHQLADALRSKPGKSIRHKTTTNYNTLAATKSRIQRGGYEGMRDGGFKAEVERLNPDVDEWGLWVRYEPDA